MVATAGEVADGLMVHPFTTRRSFEDLTLPALDRGLARAGRARADLDVAWVTSVVTWSTEDERVGGAGLGPLPVRLLRVDPGVSTHARPPRLGPAPNPSLQPPVQGGALGRDGRPGARRAGGGGGRGRPTPRKSGGRGGRGGGNSGTGGGRNTGGANIVTGNTPGLSTTLAAGLNYNDVWGKKTQVNGSYFYNSVNSTNTTDRYRETFVTNDSSLFNTNQFLSKNNNKNNRLNFEIDHRFDSMNSLLIRPEYSYQQTDNYSETNSYTTKGKLLPLSLVDSKVSSHNEGYNFTNSILFRHRFKKRGRTFSLNLTQGLNSNDRNGTNLSYDNLYNAGVDTINQVSTTNRDGKSYGANLSFTEGIGKKAQLELTYNYNHNQNNSDQRTYQLDSVTGKQDIVVPNLTNLFQNKNISNRAGANFRMQLTPAWTYSVGMAVQFAELTSNNLTTNVFLNHSFINLFPNFNIQYRKAHSKNFRFTYRGSTQQPSISQLQDVIDNSDVLNIRSGNPNLKQAFNNNFTLSYNTFNLTTLRNWSVNINGSLVSNKIENTSIINTTRDSIIVEGYKLSPGAQFTKPQNINGAYNVGAYANYSFPIKKTSKTNINLTSRVNYSHDINLVNNIKIYTDNYVLGGTVRLNMNVKERFDLNFSSTSTYNIARYSNSTQTNGDYFTQRFAAEPTYSSKSGWILSNDFDYLINTGQSSGFNQAIPLWNAGLAKLFGKKKNAELRISVFDILNQNKSITRDVEQNYIEDIRNEVLNRYFLLSFTYHLRKFKGQQPAGRNNFNRGMRNGDGNMNGDFNGNRQPRNRN